MVKRILLTVALVLPLGACDFPGLTALDNAAGELALQMRVDGVECMADSLSIADAEESQCMAYHIDTESGDTARLAVSNNPVATGGWRSTQNSAVSVDMGGAIYAGTVADTAWIVAEGSFGSADSVRVWSY